jgi:hypothetical protein
MKVIKKYRLVLYYDGYMSDSKRLRDIKAIKTFDSKPTETDIEDYIQDMLDEGHLLNLKKLNIEVKKKYSII